MATMEGISRMPIKATRALLNAALDGSLNNAEFRKDPNFGFMVPVAVPGVDSGLLDPREAWADKAAYDRTAQTPVSYTHLDVYKRQGMRGSSVVTVADSHLVLGMSPPKTSGLPKESSFAAILRHRSHAGAGPVLSFAGV